MNEILVHGIQRNLGGNLYRDDALKEFAEVLGEDYHEYKLTAVELVE